MAQRSDKLVPPVDEPVHARTGAKKTNTAEAPASSSNQAAEINARQNADAERNQRLAAPAMVAPRQCRYRPAQRRRARSTAT